MLRTAIKVAGAMLVLVGCAAPDPVATDTMAQCPDPRPELCTQDFRPVCGTRQVGADTERRTYGNACSACSNPDVIDFTDGACPE